ncbi:MAG: hypothetical protein J6X97_07000 [Lachnospiraceae bacterium]|nr:hypothetical protein [Lachnospiraceae bacterium]
MFSKYKGEFKYLKKQPVRIGLLTLVLLLMCAGVFMIGYITKGDVKNIFTIIAVLGMLPVAKMIVSFIMYLKAEKYSCSEDINNEIMNIADNKDFCLGFDFYLTSYKVNFPLLSVFIYDGSIICLSGDSKLDAKECREHIEKYLANNYINGFKVYILENKEKFYERLKSISADYAKSEADLTAYALIKSISL